MKVTFDNKILVEHMEASEAEYTRIGDKGDFTLETEAGVKDIFDYMWKAFLQFPNTEEGALEKLYAAADHLSQPEETIEMAAAKLRILVNNGYVIDQENAFIKGAKSLAARNYWRGILKSSELKR